MDRVPPRPRPARRTVCAAIAIMALVAALAGRRSAGLAAPQASAAPQVAALSNGLPLVIESRPGDTAVGVAVVVRAGARDDAPGQAGLVALLAKAVTEGSEDKPTADALGKAITALGGSLDVSIDADLTHFDAQVPSGHVTEALSVLADALTHPRFSIAGVSDALDEVQLGRLSDIPGSIAAKLWPGHPAAQSLSRMSGDDAGNLSFPDLLAARDRFYTAGNMALAVVGDVDPAAVRDQAEQEFGALPTGDAVPIVPAQAGAPDAGQTTRHTSATLGTVGMFVPTPGVLSPDYPAAHLLTLALSGPSGRLFRDVRTERGLAYLVDAGAADYTDIGALVAAAAPEADKVLAVAARFRAVLDNLSRQPPDATELALLQHRAHGELLVAHEASGSAADDDAAQTVLGQPLDPSVRAAVFDQVTTDDLQRVAAAYFTSDRAIFLLATK